MSPTPTAAAGFEPSPSSVVAESVYRLLTADPALSRYFAEIVRIEVEEIFSQQFSAPALGVAILATEEDLEGTEIELRTYLELAMITAAARCGENPWQRQDVVHHIRTVICTEPGGAIRDHRDAGRFAAEALTTFDRTPLAGRLRGGAYLYTPVRAVFRTRLHRQTRRLIDE